uniref:Uncharacterized protein n=1 Tax=Nelumbo nucifera TaxID=4432 RepID=A0A822YEE2_NELNU|nr:TPA_asm: hypothetical protein HUJ06_009751 [Nelumbo nucifera]
MFSIEQIRRGKTLRWELEIETPSSGGGGAPSSGNFFASTGGRAPSSGGSGGTPSSGNFFAFVGGEAPLSGGGAPLSALQHRLLLLLLNSRAPQHRASASAPVPCFFRILEIPNPLNVDSTLIRWF